VDTLLACPPPPPRLQTRRAGVFGVNADQLRQTHHSEFVVAAASAPRSPAIAVTQSLLTSLLLCDRADLNFAPVDVHHWLAGTLLPASAVSLLSSMSTLSIGTTTAKPSASAVSASSSGSSALLSPSTHGVLPLGAPQLQAALVTMTPWQVRFCVSIFKNSGIEFEKHVWNR
jgi:hypothetical protein